MSYRSPSPHRLFTGLIFSLLLAPFAWAGDGHKAAGPSTPHTMIPEDIQVPKPPFTEGIFPCTACHDGKSMKTNPLQRQLTAMHDDIVLQHGPESRWCLDCHDANSRDKLHLASGEKIDFTVSYLLCGQCHGDKFRDWRVGVHGKRTGSWNGQKQYLLCVNCHNPHSPHFKALKPMPPPTEPGKIQTYKGGAR